MTENYAAIHIPKAAAELTRYGMLYTDGEGWYMHPFEDGEYVKYTDVVGLFATHAPAPHVAGIEDGIERAARYIEKQRDDYVQEFGNYDPSTGVTEFSTAGEEYLSTLEELIDGIRALAGEAKP